MTRERMYKILCGDLTELKSYAKEMGHDLNILNFMIMSNVDYLAQVWLINTIHDKNGKFVRYYL